MLSILIQIVRFKCTEFCFWDQKSSSFSSSTLDHAVISDYLYSFHCWNPLSEILHLFFSKGESVTSDYNGECIRDFASAVWIRIMRLRAMRPLWNEPHPTLWTCDERYPVDTSSKLAWVPSCCECLILHSADFTPYRLVCALRTWALLLVKKHQSFVPPTSFWRFISSHCWNSGS